MVRSHLLSSQFAVRSRFLSHNIYLGSDINTGTIKERKGRISEIGSLGMGIEIGDSCGSFGLERRNRDHIQNQTL